MSTSSEDGTPASRIGVAKSPRAEQRIAYLDKALWGSLDQASSPGAMAQAWLELQCRMVDGVIHAAVFLAPVEGGGLQPAAVWPGPGDGGSAVLHEVLGRAIAERKGVVSGHRPDAATPGQPCRAAYPFVVDGVPHGGVVLELADRGKEELRAVMRQLQWGAGWIEVALRRWEIRHAQGLVSKSGIALDVVGLLGEEEAFAPACKALVTELATRIGCDMVAVGFSSGRHYKLAALSHSAEFGRRMNLVRAMTAAMEEASDQESAVIFPVVDGGDYRVTLAHAELSRVLDDATVLTIPLLGGERPVGALVFQRSHGNAFEQETLDLCDAVAAVVGPILEEKRRAARALPRKVLDAGVLQLERLFGPHYLGRKIAFVTLVVLVAFFSTKHETYRVSAPARIEGRVQRVMVAPFDGYIASQAVRAGDTVRAGAVLATLDDRDLKLELLRWTTTRQQRMAEFDQAIAERDRPGINIVKSQIQQADAHIALLEEQLNRTHLRAAFDAIIVSGDLSQSIGSAVNRGDELFRIAPLDSYRVILEVDETQVLDVEPGHTGQLKVASLLDETLPYTVRQITPITESRDGRTYFRVEAELNGTSARLRPGMEGVGKTEAGERLLILIWTQDLLNWLRLKLWPWWP